MLTPRPLLPPSAVRAHALKNCLAIVYAVNKLIESEVGEIAQRRLSRSQQAVRRMVALIEEDLRPPNSLPSEEQPDCVSAAQLLEQVRGRVEDLAQAKGVRLSFRAGSGDVRADTPALTEALANLVMNAIQSSPVGTTVAVTSDDGTDGGQLFSVRDAGNGIAPQDLRRLGTPFHSGREGGYGLGIAVACEVVARHGGLTRIESALGAGTLVSVWLPHGKAP